MGSVAVQLRELIGAHAVAAAAGYISYRASADSMRNITTFQPPPPSPENFSEPVSSTTPDIAGLEGRPVHFAMSETTWVTPCLFLAAFLVVALLCSLICGDYDAIGLEDNGAAEVVGESETAGALIVEKAAHNATREALSTAASEIETLKQQLAEENRHRELESVENTALRSAKTALITEVTELAESARQSKQETYKHAQKERDARMSEREKAAKDLSSAIVKISTLEETVKTLRQRLKQRKSDIIAEEQNTVRATQNALDKSRIELAKERHRADLAEDDACTANDFANSVVEEGEKADKEMRELKVTITSMRETAKSDQQTIAELRKTTVTDQKRLREEQQKLAQAEQKISAMEVEHQQNYKLGEQGWYLANARQTGIDEAYSIMEALVDGSSGQTQVEPGIQEYITNWMRWANGDDGVENVKQSYDDREAPSGKCDDAGENDQYSARSRTDLQEVDEAEEHAAKEDDATRDESDMASIKEEPQMPGAIKIGESTRPEASSGAAVKELDENALAEGDDLFGVDLYGEGPTIGDSTIPAITKSQVRDHETEYDDKEDLYNSTPRRGNTPVQHAQGQTVENSHGAVAAQGSPVRRTASLETTATAGLRSSGLVLPPATSRNTAAQHYLPGLEPTTSTSAIERACPGIGDVPAKTSSQSLHSAPQPQKQTAKAERKGTQQKRLRAGDETEAALRCPEHQGRGNGDCDREQCEHACCKAPPPPPSSSRKILRPKGRLAAKRMPASTTAQNNDTKRDSQSGEDQGEVDQDENDEEPRPSKCNGRAVNDGETTEFGGVRETSLEREAFDRMFLGAAQNYYAVQNGHSSDEHRGDQVESSDLQETQSIAPSGEDNTVPETARTPSELETSSSNESGTEQNGDNPAGNNIPAGDAADDATGDDESGFDSDEDEGCTIAGCD